MPIGKVWNVDILLTVCSFFVPLFYRYEFLRGE